MLQAKMRPETPAKLPEGAKPGISQLGPLETLVIECLWRCEAPLSVRDVSKELNGSWAYTTVMTTLDRLFRKGLASRQTQGRAFLYSARLTRADLESRALMSAMGRIDGQPAERDLALAALVDALHFHDPDALDALDRLVRERKRALRRSRRIREAG